MDMDGKEKQGFEAMDLREINGNFVEYDNWVIMESGENEDCEASSTTSTVELSSRDSSSMNSIESSSSELAEDASSSSSLSSTLSNGPLYELSELMVNLPIKRGLSKFYQGKSQSFTSLASAKSLEDLAKRVNNNIHKRKKMKSCKSYGGNLDAHKFSHSPKASIAKKPSKGSFLSPFSKINNRFLDG